MHTDIRSRIICVDGDIITVDFDAMRGMTPQKAMEQMIAAGKYDEVNPDIVTDRFPVLGEGMLAPSTDRHTSTL